MNYLNLFFLSILLLVTGCKSQDQNPPFEMRFPVVVQESTSCCVPLFVTAIGNVASPSTVDIRPQISGKLIKAHKKQGEFVKRGELLFTLDPKPLQAALERAKANLLKDEAQLEYAKSVYERNKELVEKEYVSKLKFDELKSNLDTAKALVLADMADVKAAEINLKYCFICSPIDGRMSQFGIDVGNNVSPMDGVPLTTIRQITPIDIHFYIAQSDFEKIKALKSYQDLTVEVSVPETPDKIFKGSVFFVDNYISLDSGTILAKARVENSEGSLFPGEFVNVKLFLKMLDGLMTVPFSSLQLGAKEHFVFVLKEDMTVSIRTVTVGDKFGDQGVILSGLEHGEKVVIDGQVNLQEGTKVYLKTSEDSAS